MRELLEATKQPIAHSPRALREHVQEILSSQTDSGEGAIKYARSFDPDYFESEWNEAVEVAKQYFAKTKRIRSSLAAMVG
jgi:hypothetical protein